MGLDWLPGALDKGGTPLQDPLIEDAAGHSDISQPIEDAIFSVVQSASLPMP